MADLNPQLVEWFQRAYKKAWRKLGSQKSFSAADVYEAVLEFLKDKNDQEKLTKQRVVVMLGDDSSVTKEKVGGKNMYQHASQPPPSHQNGSGKGGKDNLKPIEQGKIPPKLGARGDKVMRCMWLYRRLHAAAPHVLSTHLQEVDGASPENCFRNLDNDALSGMQQKLESLCRQHAPEISNGLRMECFTALAELIKPTNEAKLSSLTVDQQEFVRAFQIEDKPSKRKELVNDKTVAYIRDFTAAANKPLDAVDPDQDDVIDLDAAKINLDVFRTHFPKRTDEPETQKEGDDTVSDQETIQDLNRKLGALEAKKETLENQNAALSPKAALHDETSIVWTAAGQSGLNGKTLKAYMDTHVPRAELEARPTDEDVTKLQKQLKEANEKLPKAGTNGVPTSVRRWPFWAAIAALSATLIIVGVGWGVTAYSRMQWMNAALELAQ